MHLITTTSKPQSRIILIQTTFIRNYPVFSDSQKRSFFSQMGFFFLLSTQPSGQYSFARTHCRKHVYGFHICQTYISPLPWNILPHSFALWVYSCVSTSLVFTPRDRCKFTAASGTYYLRSNVIAVYGLSTS